jgi:hypothetical protein
MENMNFDWLANLVPILNATGIPLLGIGIVLLVRAYQKSAETYKETSAHLTEENKRLWERLHDVDVGYFDEVEKMKSIVAKSIDAIGELQIRKVALLSKPEELSSETIMSEIKKIDRAIALMQELSQTQEELKILFVRYNRAMQEEIFKLEQRFQNSAIQVGEMAGQIGDPIARVTLLGLLTKHESLAKLKSETAGLKQGLTAPEEPPPAKLPSPTSNESPEQLNA